ncbi:MAG TPA: L,D-transpeptidase, partial [Minicystis sp.]|nr:L,D-transpeptidase [Minicystis sp.]
GSVALRGGSADAARVQGSGDCRAWYAIEPFGYVCAGETATLDADDPVVKALEADAPRVGSPWPYDYGESLGAPRYASVPSVAEQHHAEWDLERHLANVAKLRAGEPAPKWLTGVDVTPAGATDAPALLPMSPLVRDDRKFVAGGSTVAFTRAFDAEGRTFLVTSDHALLPKDRVRPYPRSEFHGVELGHGEELPIVFFRRVDVPKLRLVGGRFEPTGETWPRLSHVGATGARLVVDAAHVYVQTRDGGLWAKEGDATVADLENPPKGVASAGGRRTWLDVSVLGGTLVAYEGERPVFATLISPGRGGVPFEGHDPLETASTPTGTFRVDGKFVTATMVSSTNDDLIHTEVEYVQNFHGPHALHGAYWHDAWGEPKSGGCVNLAPRDALWLFGFTEPALPEGWYGLRATGDFGPATWVKIRR